MPGKLGHQDEVISGAHEVGHARVREDVGRELQSRSARDAAHHQIDCARRQASSLGSDEQGPLLVRAHSPPPLPCPASRRASRRSRSGQLAGEMLAEGRMLEPSIKPGERLSLARAQAAEGVRH